MPCRRLTLNSRRYVRTSRRWKSRTLLGGEYDEREALLTIRSGAGGVDAADWAEMLMRMYIRWAEKHKYSVEVFDTSYAEEAGLKSATFAVHAPFAYGTLSVEQGTHRLVRISPFDNQSRRQTSFADVEVLPVVETTDHIDIPESDVRVDVYRSSGPGGTIGEHHRLRGAPHPRPHRHRRDLPEREVAVTEQVVGHAGASGKAAGAQEIRRGAPSWTRSKEMGAARGAPRCVRMWLHPYQMVKDLRTDYEVGNPAAVLDGDIDGFLEAGIRWRNRPDDE